MIDIPKVFRFLTDPPLGGTRYRVAYGGRGSMKSWNFARTLLALAANLKLRILCAREFQSSIKESVHKLLDDQIDLMDLRGWYDVKNTTIVGRNGSEFLFVGIKRDPHKIKSMEGVDICWLEEAEAISKESYRILIPTIRKPNSEIWVSFNPALETDPSWQMFAVDPPDRSIVKFVSYLENPWLPEVLREEARELRRRDPEAYEHIWGGKVWTRSEAEVLSGKWIVDDFQPGADWGAPLFGADWGFARDPTVLVRMWIHAKRLFIEYDERGVGLSMDDIAKAWERVPGSKDYKIRADNARPETINEMRLRKYKCEGAPKWSGSVEDGVAYLRSFDQIVIHPRCKGWISEARMWRYKVDPRTDDVLPKLRDGNDHGPDASRYGLAPLIQKQRKPKVWFPGMDEGAA
jgi:phage terminase large subunit